MSNYILRETKDGEFIRSLVMHPSIKPHLFDREIDPSAPLNIDNLLNPALTIYALYVNEKSCGLVVFEKNEDIATVEVAFLPDFRGKNALKFATKVFSSYSQAHQVTRFFGKIKRANKASFLFCRWCGFSEYRRDKNYYYVSLVWADQSATSSAAANKAAIKT